VCFFNRTEEGIQVKVKDRAVHPANYIARLGGNSHIEQLFIKSYTMDGA